MADNAPDAVQPKSPGKTQKKKKASTERTHAFTLVKIITDAVTEMKDRKGTSIFKMKKYAADKGVDVKKCNNRFNKTVRNMVAKGDLVQVSGNGASGSFKLPTKPAAKPHKSIAKATDKAAAKPRKAAPKSTKPAKPKTTKKSTTPKKTAAKKPAAAKRKAVKQTARKTTSKKEDKKTAGKKATKKTTPKKTNPKKRVPAKKAGAPKAKAKTGGRKSAGKK